MWPHIVFNLKKSIRTIYNIEQFTIQFNYHILLSAFGPLTICKLKVQGLDQKTKKCHIKDPFPKDA